MIAQIRPKTQHAMIIIAETSRVNIYLLLNLKFKFFVKIKILIVI